MSIDTSNLTDLVAKLSLYVHDSEDIPSWDVEEIDSQLDGILVEIGKLGAEEPLTDRRKAIIDLAREQLPLREGTVEIDGDALVSEGDENGAYVQTWGWVDFDGTDLDKEAEATAS